jgi:hypothetical protein
MKDLDNLIKSYTKKVISHEAQANNSETHNKEYHLGIAKSYRSVIDDLKSINNEMTQQLQKML